jgi:triosephosphate isomerase
MSKKMFVANWKMQLSFNQSCIFVQDNYDQLRMLAQQQDVVICPTFPALYTIAQQCKDSSLQIGAQDVSRHPSGAYTAEVSAQTLAEVGCTYCIIGHSETKQHGHETNIHVEHKLKELIKQNIVPIICIGENKEQRDLNHAYKILEEQLSGSLKLISSLPHPIASYVIAYEPVWAIGGDATPSKKILAEIFTWLHKQCSSLTNVPHKLIYGGSVNADNAHDLLAIKHLDGLLIGRASTEIETFKAIVTG